MTLRRPAHIAISEEDVRFLQQRVVLFGTVGALMGGVGWVYRLLNWFDYRTSSYHWRSMLAHGLAVLTLSAVSLLARRRQASQRSLQFIEASGMVVSCIFYGWMAMDIDNIGRVIGERINADLILVLSMSYGVIARSIIVPSTARRSLAVSAASGLALLFLVSPYGRHDLDSFGNPLTTMGPVLGSLLWWSFTVAIAITASRVIFGLRQQVREAEQLGQYVLEEKIGEGGMGIVYRARHAMLRRPTAIKLLRGDRFGTAALLRFEQEVRLTARLSHPNTVTVFDYGRTPEGVFYYAMELLQGETLQDVVDATGSLPVSRALHVVGQVAAALQEAHAMGLVHRDIKPANIMLCRQGGVGDVAKVLDFGLVRELAHSAAGSDGLQDQTATLSGTPLYIAPEMIERPAAASPRSDLYSLGAVAYFLLTGREPFDGLTTFELFAQHLSASLPPPSQRSSAVIPEAIDKLVQQCLEKDPERRPASAAALKEAIECCELRWSDAECDAWWLARGAEVAAYRDRRHRHDNSPRSGVLTIDVARR